MTREPKQRRRLAALGLLLACLLPLALFLGWLASRHARRAEPPPQPVEASAASARPLTRSPVQTNPPPAAALTVAVQTAPTRLFAQRVVRYGAGADELGVVRPPEMAPVGPESFAVAPNGNMLIADPVNQRIQVYGRDGALLRSIEVPGVSLNEVMVDARDRLFVFDQDRHALLLLDAGGATTATLELDRKDINTRGYFHVVGDAVYFADAAARDVLVATVADGRLVPPDAAAVRASDGVHGGSGRIYSWSVAKGEALQLALREPETAGAAARTLAIARPGIVAASFVGEDQNGRFHFHAELWIGGKVVLEVLTFHPDGAQGTAMRLPENDYALWTTRLLTVAADGVLVQFLPQKEQAKLNLFSESP